MHVISLYLVLHVCAATFDVMCIKKTEATKQGLKYEYSNTTQPLFFVTARTVRKNGRNRQG
jgi:hypothetical protein